MLSYNYLFTKLASAASCLSIMMLDIPRNSTNDPQRQ